MDNTIIVASYWVVLCFSVLSLIGCILIGALFYFVPELVEELREVRKWLQTLCATIDFVNQNHNEKVQPLADWLDSMENPGMFFEMTQPVTVEKLRDATEWRMLHDENDVRTEKRAAITKDLPNY